MGRVCVIESLTILRRQDPEPVGLQCPGLTGGQMDTETPLRGSPVAVSSL